MVQEKYLLQEPLNARIVTTDISNRLPDKMNVQSVQKGSILPMPTMPIHNAPTASTDNIKRLKHKIHVQIVQRGSLLQIQIMHTQTARLALLGITKGLRNKTTVTPSVQQDLFLLQAPLHAQIATMEDTNRLKHKAHVESVKWGSLLRM